jgi:hypothetical protein
VVSQKFVEQDFALFRVLPAKAGIQNGRMPYAPTKIPGFRVALSRTLIPGLSANDVANFGAVHELGK